MKTRKAVRLSPLAVVIALAVLLALVGAGCALPASTSDAKSDATGTLQVAFHVPQYRSLAAGKAISPMTANVKLYLTPQSGSEAYFGSTAWTPSSVPVTSAQTVVITGIPQGYYDALRLELCDSAGNVLTGGWTSTQVDGYTPLSFWNGSTTNVRVYCIPNVPLGNDLIADNSTSTYRAVSSGDMTFYRVPVTIGFQYDVNVIPASGTDLVDFYLFNPNGAPPYSYTPGNDYEIGNGAQQTLYYTPTSNGWLYIGIYGASAATYALQINGPVQYLPDLGTPTVKKGVLVANGAVSGVLEYLYTDSNGDLWSVKSADGGTTWGARTAVAGASTSEPSVYDFAADLDGNGNAVVLYTFNSGTDATSFKSYNGSGWTADSYWTNSGAARYPNLFRDTNGGISFGIGFDFTGINVADGFGIVTRQWNPPSNSLVNFGGSYGTAYGGSNDSLGTVDNPYCSQIFSDPATATKLYLYSDNHWDGYAYTSIGYVQEGTTAGDWGTTDYKLVDPVTAQPSDTAGVSEPMLFKLYDTGGYLLLYVATDTTGHRSLCKKVAANIVDLNAATAEVISTNDVATIDYASGPYRAYYAAMDPTSNYLIEVAWRSSSGVIRHALLLNSNGSIYQTESDLLVGNYMLDGVTMGGSFGPFYIAAHDAQAGLMSAGAPTVMKVEIGW